MSAAVGWRALTGDAGRPQVAAGDARRRLTTSHGALAHQVSDDTAPSSQSDTDSDSAAASKPSSLQGSIDEKESDYTDTICSNRSDFFKRYYAAQFSPAKSEPISGTTNGYAAVQQTEVTHPSAAASAAHTTVNVKKPPAKKARLRHWLSQVRFSWVAMSLLFVVIISSICVIVLQYNIHKSKYAFFGRFKFSEAERRLRLLSPETGEEVARLYVASLVPNEDQPYDCGLLRSTRVSHTSKYLAEATSEGSNVCLEWKNEASMILEHVRPERLNCTGPACRGIQCYRVGWSAQRPRAGLMDCVSLTEPAAHTWFGSSETADGGGWPLAADVPLAPLVTGDIRRHVFGNVVQRSFISSGGVGLFVYEDQPLFMKVDAERGRLCIGNLHTPFPYRYGDDRLKLQYSICTGPSIAALHQFGTHVHNPYGKRIEATRRKVWPSLGRIVYHFPGGHNYTQEEVIAYGEDVVSRRYGSGGWLVLDSRWQAHQGDIEFDRRRFHNAWKANELLQRRGLELAVTLSPVVELKSDTMEAGIDTGLWVREAITGDPALVNLPEAKGCWMDLSSAKTRRWLREKLVTLRRVTKIKWVVIDHTSAQLLPFYYNLTKPVGNPDFLSEELQAVVRQAGLEVLSCSSVIRPRPEPVFARLSPRPATWRGLSQVLPSVLAAATGGTHLVAPPAVGGSGGRPEPELYARWLQLACFLPQLHFSLLPHQLGSRTEALASRLLWRRRRLVLPAYRAALRQTLAEGWPLVRPLWHAYGNDRRAAAVTDQFLIGRRLLVAPVAEPNVTSRPVFLPPGLWRELGSGRLSSGGRWIDQPVTPDNIPHYELYRP